MSKFLQKDCNILNMHSEWVGESLIRTVTSHFGKIDKIMVDVQEITPKRTSKQRALKAARDAARRVGCTSVDCCQVSDIEMVRQSRNIHTDEPVRTFIRTSTFAFNGLPK